MKPRLLNECLVCCTVSPSGGDGHLATGEIGGGRNKVAVATLESVILIVVSAWVILVIFSPVF